MRTYDAKVFSSEVDPASATRPSCSSNSKLTLESNGNVSTRNVLRCALDEDYWVMPIDTTFQSVDAYYEGHITFRVAGDKPCSTQPVEASRRYTLRVGPTGEIKGTQLRRNMYDRNPVFLQLGPNNTASGTGEGEGATRGDVWIQTSTSKYEHGQPWTLSARRANDGYEISGSMSSYRYSGDTQRIELQLEACEKLYVTTTQKLDWVLAGCNTGDFNFTGHVSPARAAVTVQAELMVEKTTVAVEWRFEGDWTRGSKLLVGEDRVVKTDGKIGGVISAANSLKGHVVLSLAVAVSIVSLL